MAVQEQDDQLELTYSNYVRTQDVNLKTCVRRWVIGRSGERGSEISVLAARHDDDDDEHEYHPNTNARTCTHRHLHIYIYIYIYSHPQTDCFVLSELFSEARRAGPSKPVQLYVRLCLRPVGHQANHVG